MAEMRCLVCGTETIEEDTQWRCPRCDWTLLREAEDEKEDDDDMSKYGDMNY